MRIAIVVNRFPTLSETFIFNKVKGLVKNGFDVTIITHASEDDSHVYKAELNEVRSARRLRAFGKKDFFSPWLYFSIVANFLLSLDFVREYHQRKKPKKHFLRNYLLWLRISSGYDIIHFEYTGIAVTYLDVLEFLKPSIVFTSCRGAAEQIKPIVDTKRATDLRRLFTKVDRVHCVSNDMMETCINLYGLNPQKAFVNRPAIDTMKFKRSHEYQRDPRGPYVICSTGRLHWKKGFEYALLSMNQMRKLGYSFRYEIIGNGQEMEKLRFMAHDLNLENHVVFHGGLTSYQVKERLESCDIYLLPSVSEGISNALLEAMAMAIPVIATRAGGMEEVIEDNKSGLLVDPYNVEQLTDRLVRLIEDESLRNHFSINGKSAVCSEYKLERQIRVFVEQYEHAIHGQTKGKAVFNQDHAPG